ncbi:MAG: hypothetical protein IV085_01045 [Thiobacillus sp.]|nr:hypothetical protein [Thiobacillus sp.]
MARPALRLRLPPGLGKAFWVATLIVLSVEMALHSDAVLQRYRSVFAVGRAMDKLRNVVQHPPQVLFVGNSRADNGIDPRAVARASGRPASDFYNLGLPGANFLAYHGVVKRLDAEGLFGPDAIHTVVLALDESALQDENSLGYVGFLADRSALWHAGRYRDWLGSWIHLWSYSANLRQLREPDKLTRLIQATVSEVEPVGGSTARHLGYRAGFGGTQDSAQAVRQELAARLPPASYTEPFMWELIDTLQRRGVRVVVTVPPLRDRVSAYYSLREEADPYRALLERIRQRGVTLLPEPAGYRHFEFIDLGHLNDTGAQRYSQELGRQLRALGI